MFELNNDDAQLPDEREVEISDLPGKREKSPQVQRISLGARFSSRQRHRQAMITSAIMLAALIALLLSISPVKDLLMANFSGSSSTSAVLTGNNLFYFQDLPSWGMVFVDDKPLARAPTVDSAPPTRLPDGIHYIRWQAEPFKPLSCILAVPADPERQTCMTRATGTNEYTRNATLIAFPITPSLDLLPLSQQRVLIQHVQDLLDRLQSDTTVQKGEYYTYKQGGPLEIAASPLQARLRFQLETNTSSPGLCIGPNFGAACSFEGNDCRKFCTLNWPQDGTASAVWHIAALVRPTWQYVTQEKASTLPPAADRIGSQYFVAFRVEWRQGKWLVSFHQPGASSFDDPNCIAAIGMVMSDPSYLFIDSTQQRVTWTFSSGANRASGCLARATLHDSTMQLPLSEASEAYVLYRFGVLVSASDSASHLWPHLPSSNQAIQDIAAAIARQPAFVS